jgi:predicted RNA-binding protein with EMAP domain
MNEEEKEAIKSLKNIAENAVEYDYLNWEEIDAVKTVLNLIQKQDKIIESYKEILKWSSHKKKNNTMDYVKVNKNNKFGTNGICQDMKALKRTGKVKYRAYITFQGKQYTLGTHDSLEEAKKARANVEEEIKCIKEYFKKVVDEDEKKEKI